MLTQFTCTGERGEVVASLPIEETGVGKPPHVLRLYLCPVEPTLYQHPHKQGEEVCEMCESVYIVCGGVCVVGEGERECVCVCVAISMNLKPSVTRHTICTKVIHRLLRML